MKVWMRFITYLTLGLLIFCAYFYYSLPFFLRILLPQNNGETVIDLQDVMSIPDTLRLIGGFLICFLSAAILLSLFLVMPIINLISAIQFISEEKVNSRSRRQPLGGKVANFLFKEVFHTVENLEKRLDFAEKERQVIEDAKQTWIEGVSHDLKTPLSYITGYSSLLLNPEYNFTKSELKSYLATIYDKGQEMVGLIDDLNFSFILDSGYLLPLHREYVNPSTQLLKIVESLDTNKLRDKYQFIFTAPKQPFLFWLDTKLFKRAMTNLVFNCIEHNPPGTIVRVSCDEDAEGNMIIVIEDNGLGMNNATLKHCLNKHYSRSEGGRSGKGLGLYIVKNILDAHRASMTIASQEKKGTQIRLVFTRDTQSIH